MEELITYIVRSLVDKPDQVQLRGSDADGQRTYELKVAPEDVGKVIGRDGRTVSAIRTLLSTAGQRLAPGLKVRLELLDDRRGPQSSPPAPSAESPGGPSGHEDA